MSQITIRHKYNELFRYIISLDKDNRVSHIENKWDVSAIPAWYGMTFDINKLNNFIANNWPELYLD